MRHVWNLSISLGLGLLAVSCSDSDESPQADGSVATPVQEGFVDAGSGVLLYYRAVGEGRDTVVVLHGGPGFNMEYFAADLAPMAERHALIFYDQRGTGGSTLVRDSAALDAQRFVEDLDFVRDHFGLERMTILGHSWGAGLAALYAIRYPDRVGRLLIVGALPLQRHLLVGAFEQLDADRDSTERKSMQEWYEARVANPDDADACRAYYSIWFRPFFADSVAARSSQGDFCAGTEEARRNKIASVDRFTMGSLGAWDWRESLRGVQAATLVIHGTVDPLPLDGAREWAAALPNARLLVLEGVGHFPYLEAPQEFFAAAREFVAGGWPERAQVVRR